MFITNKRVITPSFITVNGVKIEAVNKFKLLGITIDSDLSFQLYVTELRKQINKRLYSIKKLFYLSFSVKVQFFKIFLLPTLVKP